MFRSVGATLAAVLGSAFLLAPVSFSAHAAGAIAFNPHNMAWGWAAGYSTQTQAKNQANYNCQYNCNKWVTFSKGQCAFAAADWSQVGGSYSGSYGWGRSSDKQTARNRALNECTKHGGRNCRILVWSCD